MTMANGKHNSVSITEIDTTENDTIENEQDAPDKFLLEELSKIATLSKEELSKLEGELALEFKQTSKQYVEARLARIQKLVEKVNQLLKVTRANDKNWMKVSRFEIETINNIKYNVENLILLGNGLKDQNVLRSFEEYELESKEIVKNLQSPLVWDESLKDDSEDTNNNETDSNRLVFPYYFQEVFKPYKKNLKTIVNEKNYQKDLIYNSSLGSSTIIWKQYYNNLVKKKQKLADDTSKELFELYKEFHHINENEMAQANWKQYYKSVISINDLKRGFEEDYPSSLYKYSGRQSHDTNYVNLDNQYLQNNRVESSNIKRGILKKIHEFSVAQDANGNSNKRVKLNVLSGLNDDEVDSDLFALRSYRTGKSSSVDHEEIVEEEVDEKVIADESGNEYDVVQRYVGNSGDLVGLDIVEDYDSYDGSSDEEFSDAELDAFDSDNEYSDSEDDTLEKVHLKAKYKFILGFKGTQYARSKLPHVLQSTLHTTLRFAELPPLELFPKLV